MFVKAFVKARGMIFSLNKVNTGITDNALGDSLNTLSESRLVTLLSTDPKLNWTAHEE